MKGIWKTWLTAWSGIAILLGLELAGAALPAADSGAVAYFALVNGLVWDPTVLDPPGMRFAVSVLGAILLGWGLTILVLVRTPTVPRAVWVGVTASMGVWFLIDSAASLATGVPLNAVVNAVFLTGYLSPVLASGVLRRSDGNLIADPA